MSPLQGFLVVCCPYRVILIATSIHRTVCVIFLFVQYPRGDINSDNSKRATSEFHIPDIFLSAFECSHIVVNTECGDMLCSSLFICLVPCYSDGLEKSERDGFFACCSSSGTFLSNISNDVPNGFFFRCSVV